MISDFEVQTIIRESLASLELEGKRLLMIVPDGTRTAPIGQFFKHIHSEIGSKVKQLDVMFALGTHPPMTDEQMHNRLEIQPGEYPEVGLLNHAWQDPDALTTLGTIPESEISELTGGLFSMDVVVRINKVALAYDQLLIVGPVFPHEVVGFSGGSKYLFPGISGPEVLNFFHWLGAIITNAEIIGTKSTPVRSVIEKAASMVSTPCHAFCLVVSGEELHGVEFGKSVEAWSRAADISAKHHIERKSKPFHTVLSCAPEMYDELWVGGKCMYKLEPVVADGGELIIYAPHIHEISITHGEHIERIGYHVRDYFVKQWDKFKDEPWGVLAHSTHVRGGGTYENGVEIPRVRVTLATGIPEETCRKINLGYRDPASINPEDFMNKEEEGILYVPHAGEVLFRLG